MVVTLGGYMIPAYPTNIEPTLTLDGNIYPLSKVDFIMWVDDSAQYGIGASGEDGNYDNMIASDEWSVVLNDDTVITVLQSELGSDTREHLLNLAFPG